MRNARRILALLALVALAGGVARAQCQIQRYERVALYGTTDDPDVLVWDSRLRMRGYEDGTFDEMNALLPHARLTPPGTRAEVQACVSGYVQPPYMKTPDDAIGVLIMNGPLRGLYGWVLGSEVRSIAHPGPRRR
jgi:hypothetical protein